MLTIKDFGVMHESVWKDDVKKFTRAWFAWANEVFADLVVWVLDEKPFGVTL